MQYDVPLIPQQTGMSCWAAGIAMIVSWKFNCSIDPAEIARKSGYAQQYVNGLDPNDSKIFSDWGLVPEAPQTYTVDGFAQLLRDYGPLWVAAAVPGPHIRVVTGFDPDPDASKATVYVNDPWERGMTNFRLPNKGATYSESYLRFVQMNEALGFSELSQPQPVYVAHLPHKR